MSNTPNLEELLRRSRIKEPIFKSALALIFDSWTIFVSFGLGMIAGGMVVLMIMIVGK